MIVRRECDVPMARSKGLLPCDKDCKNCMACIETTNTGERRHCTRHKFSNLELDMLIARVGMEPEKLSEIPPAPKEDQTKWTEMEEKRVVFLKKQGMNCKQIADRMGRTTGSVRAKLKRMKGEEA